MVLVAKPMFSIMRNHLEPISEAPDRPEGQELSMYQVGVTGGLHPPATPTNVCGRWVWLVDVAVLMRKVTLFYY